MAMIILNMAGFTEQDMRSHGSSSPSTLLYQRLKGSGMSRLSCPIEPDDRTEKQVNTEGTLKRWQNPFSKQRTVVHKGRRGQYCPACLAPFFESRHSRGRMTGWQTRLCLQHTLKLLITLPPRLVFLQGLENVPGLPLTVIILQLITEI